MLNTGTLIHGGLMVNYRCTAACRHCLYSCSPTRGDSGYISGDSADTICRLLRSGGCRSVHIGGGEPFLDFEGLLMVIKKLKQAGITVEYIETNAYWAAGSSTDKSKLKKALDILKRLTAEGSNTLCISIDPFHAEHIPYGAPLALAELCDKTGVDYFLWKQEYLPALSHLDSEKAHTRADMETNLSSKYISATARTYGIEYGGRAVNIEKEFGVPHPVESFAVENTPCRRLLSTGHFHVDMHSNFIPPGCTGIRIPLSEAVDGIPEGKYPAFEALYSGGVAALYELARKRGFSPDKTGYPSKCNLCFHIRHFLSEKDFPELDGNHYEEGLRYY